jgi:hypothetical protein
MTWRALAAGRLPAFVAGLYCVVATVMPVGLQPGVPPAAGWLARLALACLLLGLLAPSPRIALWVGIGGVLGCSIGTFGVLLWAGRAIEATPLGVLGFFALSLAWGALSSPAAEQGALRGTRAEWLAPRRSVPAWQVLLASLFVVALPLLLLLPLGLEQEGEATFGLVAALGLILLLLPRAADLVTRFWLRRL